MAAAGGFYVGGFDFAGFYVTIDGTWATTEADDTMSFAGGVVVSGSWATTEVADTSSIAGQVVSSGPWASTEAADASSFAGSVYWSLTWASTDQADSFVGVAFAGLFFNPNTEAAYPKYEKRLATVGLENRVVRLPPPPRMQSRPYEERTVEVTRGKPN